MTTAPDAAITITAMICLAALAVFAVDRGLDGNISILWAVIMTIALKGGYSIGKTSGTSQAVSEITDCLRAADQTNQKG
jgi:hypothetical protein